MTIAGMFPLDLLANVEARVYHQVDAMKNEGHMTFDWEIENMWARAHKRALYA